MRILFILALTACSLVGFAQKKSDQPNNKLRSPNTLQPEVQKPNTPSNNYEESPKKTLANYNELVKPTAKDHNPADTLPMRVTRKPTPISENNNQASDSPKKD